LLSRHGHDLTSRFPAIASALATLDATTAILDGELVATNDEGLPDFRALHRRSADARLAVWVFDLLEVNGHDVRPLSLEERRQHLEQQLASHSGDGTLRYSESFADPARLLAAAHDLVLEGVVSKRLDAPYRSGRRPEWVKVKTESWRIANGERWRSPRQRGGPQRGRISVDIGAPIKPDGDDFAAVVRLRDAARSFLLAHCHAPDLVQEKMDLSAWAQL
jgi:bifunctional non-homologous end joining protein LigD